MKKTESPASQRKMNSQMILFLRLLFVGFSIVSMFMIADAIRSRREQKPSLNWPTTTGQIIASEWRVASKRKGTTFEASVGYSYKAENERYVSYQICLWNPNLRGVGPAAKDFVSEHRIGSDVVVHYDPKNPEQAVLIPGDDSSANNFALWGGIGAMSLSIGMLFAIRKSTGEGLFS